MKVLRAPAEDRQARMRFERECHALGAVSGHPNIVAVHEGGFTDDGRAYLVMEFCARGSLLDHLQAHGVMTATAVSEVATKIATALRVAHQGGVLHRDVKPANILVTAFGEPALADFGIARVDGGEHTTAGIVTASFAHSAPEVLQGEPPSPAADVYSLGSTMYELLTGGPAHFHPEDESVWAMISRTISDPLPDMALAGIPEPLATTIRGAMAKSVEHRFGSANELLVSLAGGGHRPEPRPSVQPTSIGPASQPLPRAETLRIAAGATTPESIAFEPDPLLPVSVNDRSSAGRRPRRWLIVGLTLIAIVALGGAAAALRFGGGEAPGPVVVAFPDGGEGPLDAGTRYNLVASGGDATTSYVLKVDDVPVGAAGSSPIAFTPVAGRSTITVEATTGDLVETSEEFEIYAVGELPPAGIRVNLGSFTAQTTNWATTLARYDELVSVGHLELELLPSSRFASLTPGFWNLYVPGFGEDRSAGEAYCSSFDLEIPNDCFVSRFDPNA